MRRALVMLVALLLGAGGALAQSVGEGAPDFVLVDAEGAALRLSDLAGTPVLLNFWATWCPPCREELPLFQRAADALKGDLTVLLVNNNEGREQAVRFLEANGVRLMAAFDATREQRAQLADYGLTPDSTLEVMRRYRARGMPTTVFIDARGKVASVWVGLITPVELAAQLAGIGVVWQP